MGTYLALKGIKKDWEKLSELVNGEFHFLEYEKSHVKAGIITAKIKFKYKGLNILIHQGILQKRYLVFNPVELTSTLDKSINFNLSIWEIDFLEKFFNPNRLRTGFKDFDKKFAIKGEPGRDLIHFFRDEDIRKIFFKNKNIFFNISEDNNQSQIKLKGINYLSNFENIEYLKNIYIKLIERLTEIKIFKF